MIDTAESILDVENAEEVDIRSFGGNPECDCEPRWARRQVGKEQQRVGRLRMRLRELEGQLATSSEENQALKAENARLLDYVNRLLAALEEQQQDLDSQATGTGTPDSIAESDHNEMDASNGN